MSRLRDILLKIEGTVDNPISALRHRWVKRDPARLRIFPYRSYGTPEYLQLRGRILGSQRAYETKSDDSWWENLSDMVHRFASNELAGVSLQAMVGDIHATGVSGEDGYFALDVAPAQPMPSGWQLIKLSAPADDNLFRDGAIGHAEATAEVLIPPADARFGVISDIDDTVVVTQATDMLKMARLTLLGNAQTRLPFAGVAAFYRALQTGQGGSMNPANNPIFYVSSSPWNLYDLLVDFLAHNAIPAGPLLLADYGLGENSFPFTSHDHHKMEQIERIMGTYPDLPFILIGDSGQRDTAIYSQLAEKMPDRVLAIYIRAIDQASDVSVKKIGDSIDLVTAPDTRAIAQHALENGWIDVRALAKIETDREKDEGSAFPLETIVGST